MAAPRKPRPLPQPRTREYVDFLGSQSPYDAPKSADLAALARLVEVEVFLSLASRPRCRGSETARDFINLTTADSAMRC
jgi:hypothetical protein